MSILSLLFPDFISRALGANDLLLADCRTYLSILMGFAPACMLQTLFQSYLVTAGAPHLGLFLTMIAGIINAGLDYVLIVSCDLGIAGAALATGLGQMVPALDGITLMAFGSCSMQPTVATPPDFFTSSLKNTLIFAAARPASTLKLVGVVPA